MAHLWLRDDDSDWAVLPVDKGVWDLVAHPPRRLRGKQRRSRDGGTVILLSSGRDAGAEPAWMVITSSGTNLRINGRLVSVGICALEDRDELRVDGRTLFFSAERLAEKGSFPAGANPFFCPRCKQALEDETPAVRCPGCGVWHHESEELPCWSYAPTCALCEQSTDLEVGYRWTPEEL